jgi:hypothetical protein
MNSVEMNACNVCHDAVATSPGRIAKGFVVGLMLNSETAVDDLNMNCSSDVSVTKINGCGHLDVLYGSRSEFQVYAPILGWIRRHRN